MQKISVWAISILLVTPAIAGGYLPTVDVSGGVSARAAFGVAPQNKAQDKSISKNVVSRKSVIASSDNNLA